MEKLQEVVQAARKTAAVADLTERGKFRVVGSERKSWFHGMTSNTVNDLEPGAGNYGTILTDRGKVVSDYRLIVRPGFLLFDVEPSLREKVFGHLNRFLISEDAELQDVTEQWGLLHLFGPAAGDLLRQVFGVTAPPIDPYSSIERGEWIISRINRFGEWGYDLWLPPAASASVLERLHNAGVPQAEEPALEVLRLESGIPRCTVDFDENIIPLEAQLHHAISYKKGCYVGQEIVARMHFRGHPNKLLVGLRLPVQEPPEPLTDLYADPKAERRSGWITSAAYSPTLGCVVGLGYVRVQLAEPGNQLLWRREGDAVPVEVVATPLLGENEMIPEPD
ncbi:MAG: glycine cleavage system protein T [Candidatus Poribacteria bacterium]|nr:MAG: glycine cleavage system protein T [Candidatus Poribacteria bacterium]